MGDEERSHLGEFGARLASEDVDVVFEALDDYQSAQANTRWGVDNPYWPLDDAVLAAARRLLGQPPSDTSHESALTMLWHLGEEQDADLIADALEGASDPGVREMALRAAGNVLQQGAQPSRRLLDLLTAMVLDEGLDVRERREALRAFADLDLEEVEELLVSLGESSDPELRVNATYWLVRPLRLPHHRDRVRRLLNSWPADAPERCEWELGQIREAIEGFHSTHWTDSELADPALRQAHDQLMFPSGDTECLRAFTTLLRSEDPTAVGIALDHYESYEGLRRMLRDEDRVEALLPEVLGRAREVLRRPMSPAEVSALDVLAGQDTEPGDVDLLLDVLARTNSAVVRGKVLQLALGVLDEQQDIDNGFLTAVADLVLDPSVDFAVLKQHAMQALAEATGTDEFLLKALSKADPEVRAYAAWLLVEAGGLDRHRAILEEFAETWHERASQISWQNPVDMILGKPHSVYWKGHRLTDPELRRAHNRLRAPGMDESYHQAMRTLLESDDPAAVGIALDHWSSPDGAVRRGGQEARDPALALVMDRVRELLRRPLSPVEPEATHLSALDAFDTGPARHPFLAARILESAGSVHVRVRMMDTAEAMLDEDLEEVFATSLVEALGKIACDPAVPLSDRLRALAILDESPGSLAVDALVRATRCPEIEVQATAAWGLMWDEIIDDHRPLLEELSAGWPVEDPPREVTRVREVLDASEEPPGHSQR